MLEVSIVIPTYNRVAQLRACLRALARQSCIDNFEVIVVVDGSTDGTPAMLAELALPYPLHIETQPRRGQAAAQNHGANVAVGHWLVFLDDDILADRDLVAAHVRAQRERPLVGIGRLTCLLPPGADGFARQFATWWEEHYARVEQRQGKLSYMDCWSGNMSLLRETFLQVGGFAEDLPRYHDLELGYRLASFGLAFGYVPDALGHQHFQKGFAAIARDAEAAGRASVALYRRHPPMLRRLRLGRFHAARLRFVLARRLLLAVRPPPRVFASASHVMSRVLGPNSWYGLVTDYCYWVGVRRATRGSPLWRRLTGGTAILAYHGFGRPGEPASRFVVPLRRFARQMAWLQRRGYHVLSLDEYLQHRADDRLPPERSIVLTIDDGYAEVAEAVEDVLQRCGFSATLFLVSEALGGANTWDRDGPLAGRRMLSWDTIARFGGRLVTVGAHSRTHALLTTLSPNAVRSEIAGSRDDLAQRLSGDVQAFAYPYGASNPECQTVAEQAGLVASFTMRPGFNCPATPPHQLRRTEVYGTDSLLRFGLAVWLGDALRGRRQSRRRP
jgi:GT2 family glycosyltransferase/peptidoglycan/xylan/chitin deacetylase (PgdA/CDA1 family)